MKTMKRVLSFLLAAVIVLGLVPVSVFAAQETVTGSFEDTHYLFFATDRHTNTSIIGEMIDAMEKSIGENNLEYLGLGGDMVGSGNDHPPYNSSTVLGEVMNATSSLNASNVDIVAGIHDMNVTDDAGIVLPYSGGGAQIYEGEDYYVYGVPESCISGAVSGVDPETEANDFITWANSSAVDASKVIIVLSHYPLHQRRNDNNGASYWATALNKVAVGDDTTIDRNIVFFWGHNHTGETSADTAVYHVAPNGSISVQGGSSNQTIYFTYANAGYLNAKSSATLMTITNETIKFEKYVNSSVSTTNTVNRVKTGVPKTLAVTGETLYQVGESPEISEVKITYMDETEKVITEGYALSKVTKDGVETAVTDGTYTFDAVGTYTLTYTCTVSGYQAQANLVVTVEEAEVTTGYAQCWDNTEQVTVEVTGAGITKVEATNVTGKNEKYDEVFTEDGHIALDIALTGYTEGGVKYSISVVADLDVTNLELYYVDESGNLIPVEFQLVSDDLNNLYVEFTTTYVGTFVYGSAAVPEGYTASKLTLENIPKDVFRENGVDLTNAVITVTYTKEGEEDFVRKLTIYDYTEENWYYVNEAGAQTFTFTFEDLTATQPIYIWDKTFTANDVTVTVGDGEFGVGSINATVLEDSAVADAIDFVIEGDNFVAYDISLNFAEGYATKQATKTVTLPIPAGVTNPVVYYVSEDGIVAWMNKATIDTENNTITFTTTHFSTYVVGEGVEIETESGNATIEGSSTTTTKDVWVKVDAPTNGGEYLIVSTGTAGTAGYILGGSSVTPVSGTLTVNDVNGSYIYFEGTGTIWTASGSGSSWSFANGSNYLGYTQSSSGNEYLGGLTYSYAVNTAASSTIWTLNSNQLYIYLQSSTAGSLYGGSDSSANYYLAGGSEWSMSDTATNVYFYQKVSASITTGTPGHTYSVEGTDIKDAVAIKGQTVTLSSALFDTPDGGTTTDITASSGLTPTYEVVTTKGNPAVISKIENGVATLSGVTGTAVVKVTYTSGDLVAWDEFLVTASTPDHYSIELHKATLTKAESFEEGTTYYVFNTKTGFYEPVENLTAFEDGVTYYKTPVIQGEVINDVVVLKGIEGGEVFAVWAVVKAHTSADDTEGTDLGALGDSLTWSVSDTGIADINTQTGAITFTGEKYGDFTVNVRFTGADGIIYEDTIRISATESLYTVPEDGTDDFPEYPNQGAVRFDKTASAVGAFSQTGMAMVEISMTGVPYSTGNELDVVLVLDMTGSMDDVSSSSSEPTGYTRIDATIASAKAFIKSIVINEDGTYNDNRIGIYVFNKDGASTLYDLAAVDTDAKLQALIGKIADGGTEFDSNYTKGKLDTIWTDYGVSGGTPYDDGLAKAQSVLAAAKTDGTGNERKQFCVFMTDGVPTSYAYVNGTTYGTHSSASAVAGMLTSASDYATRDTDYKYEYYSTEMKKAGVTVYSVGVGLFNENNAWSGSATQCGNLASALLNDISGPANEESQPDAVGTATLSKQDSYFFSVADADAGTQMTKIFSNIAQEILEAATDVVVEDKIGAGYTVNFSMPSHLNSNATAGLEEFYIQLVDYVLDATTHERTDDYTVLENFTFNANGTLKSHTINGIACGASCAHVTTTDGKITKIEGTYFQFEENEEGQFMHCQVDKLSSTELALQYFVYLLGSEGTEIPAGTYYTNEYATITYTNYNGVEVQQEFPVPQMTWNGAQVRYVFYLVNEKGQPVNRQGRVVPFSEAVYVTDVFVDSMVWNKLDQNESFDAALKAAGLLPEVYELYDKGARYDVHVFENEYGSNLNNHFLISSDFTQAQVTAGEKAWTTYVFNNKSDTTKYNVPGYYALGETFWCIGLGTVNLGTDGNPSSYNKAADEVQILISYDGKLTGFTQNQWQELGKNEQYAVILINDADYKIGVDKDSDGNVDGYYLYYKNEDGSWYTIVNKESDARVEEGFDFANTAVAFAVVWTPGLKEDTVVVDFGLDVVVDVITNDIMIPGVVGLGNTAPTGIIQNTEPYDAQQLTAQEVTLMIGDLAVGKATITQGDNAHVRITFDKTNGMQLSQPVSFFYEAKVEYYAEENGKEQLVAKYMYSKVTIIPATTVYYEDEYVTLTTETKTDKEWNQNEESGWVSVGNTSSKNQAVDRPGADKIGAAYDADNNYGYDAAYDTMSEYSMGSAAMVQVYNNYRAKATFEFYGTGFDVISLTSNTTGTITVSVYPWDATAGKYSDAATTNYVVDTYYGYTKDANGEWVVSENDPNALYQVPVMKVSGLSYGKYKVVIVAAYGSIFDHGQNGGGKYDFYLDAIRIYDPCGTDVEDTTVGDIYEEDGEGWPTYQELRNMIITADTFNSLGDSKVEGVVFIDSADETYSVADYTNYGPNNELYLAPGQAIAFELNAPTITGKEIASIQLGIKTVGKSGSVKVYSTDNVVALNQKIATATDMYYDIQSMNTKTVVIENTGAESDAIISLTNIKVTYKTAPSEANEVSVEQNVETIRYSTLSLRSRAAAATTTMATATTMATSEGTEETTTVEEVTYMLSVNADTVARALEAMAVEEQVEPEEPGAPVEPEVPEEPETPEEPEIPEEPEVPEEPETPEKPEKPDHGNDKPGHGNDKPDHDHDKPGHGDDRGNGRGHGHRGRDDMHTIDDRDKDHNGKGRNGRGGR